jgi:hypothetical protein
MSILNLEALKHAPLEREPFEHILVPKFIQSDALAALAKDFPAIAAPGSIPPSELAYGPSFAALLKELEAEPLRDLMAERFRFDLRGRPSMLTVRGLARPGDGRIHADSADKLITVLIYLNADWAVRGGRLRLLRSAHNLEDWFLEVPPEAGVMLAFRCRPNAWHGHKPFSGSRRVVQLNWVRNERVVRRELFRHRLSAKIKRFKAALRLAG